MSDLAWIETALTAARPQAMGALLRHWLARGKRLLWFNRCMAAILVLTAWWMLSV